MPKGKPTGKSTPPQGPPPVPEAWGDPLPLDQVPAAPEFPMPCLPGPIAAFIMDVAERMQTAIDYIAIAVIMCLAGCIGNTVRIRPKKKDSWEERPCLYAMVIGPVSSLKTPAMAAAMKILLDIEAENMADHKEAMARFEREMLVYAARKKAYEAECKKKLKSGGHGVDLPPFECDEPVKPAPKRLRVTDTTVEKVAELMMASRGLTLFIDELSSFLLNLQRYSNGTDRKFYLQAYNGGPFAVDRIKRGSMVVPDLYICIVGSIQPSVVRQIFADAGEDDGFFERFGLCVYPGPPTEWKYVDREPDRTVEHRYRSACRRLHDTDFAQYFPGSLKEGQRPYARFDAPAQKSFVEWYSGHRRRMLTMSDAAERQAAGKGEGLVCRLALVIHLAAWACGEEAAALQISETSIVRAITLAEEYLFPMRRRVLAAFSTTQAESAAEGLAEKIASNNIESFTVRDIRQRKWKGLKDNDAILDAVGILKDHHWVQGPVKEKTCGRSKDVFLVNPEVLKT